MGKRTAQEAASELRRELGVRRRCYGRWIADGKLTDVEANDRLERMDLALELVDRVVALQAVPERRAAAAALPARDADSVSPELVT
jgi:hypothetical protein